MVIVAIPLLVLAFLGIHRHYRKIARRLRAGTDAVRVAQACPEPGPAARTSRSTSRPRARSGTRGRSPNGDVRALHAPGRAPTRRSGRAGSSSPAEPRLEILDRRRTHRRRARRGLAAAARRDRRRHRRRPGAVRARRSCPRRGRDVVPAQAPAALRAGRRRRRRAGSDDRRGRKGGRRAGSSCACSSRTSTPARCARSTTRSRSASRTRVPSRSHSTATRRDKVRGGVDERRASRCRSTCTRRRTVTSAHRSSRYLRELTADPDTVVNVVMPEVVVRGWAPRSCTTSGRCTSSVCSCSSGT